MRHFWVALFCIVLSVSGSMIPAAHTMAHAQLNTIVDVHAVEDHTHDHDAHEDDLKQSKFDEHHHSKGHPGDHGAELHVNAIGTPTVAADLPLPDGELRVFYTDLQPLPPLLPPEPDPDRA